MGAIRMENLSCSSQASLAHIVDSDTLNAAQFASHFRVGPESTSSSLAEALENHGDSFDAVWVAAPTHLHKEMIHQCAAAKKHVAVEKPVAMSVEDTAACYDICESENVALHCSFQRRSDPTYIAVHDGVKGGHIGQVQSIHVVFRDHPGPPIEFLKTGGDIFHDLAVHDIDYVCWVLGQQPVAVMGMGASQHPDLVQEGIHDLALVVLRFADGCTCTIDLSRHAPYGYDQRTEFCGQDGVLQVQNPQTNSAVYMSSEGTSSSLLQHSFPERFEAAYKAEISDFVLGVQQTRANGTNSCSVDKEHVCGVSRVAEAARISALEGSRWISAEEFGGASDRPSAEELEAQIAELQQQLAQRQQQTM